MITNSEIQAMFVALTLNGGRSKVVHSNEDHDGNVIVWYTGSDEDLAIFIDRDEMVDHINSHGLNYVYTSVDHGYFAEVDYYLSEFMDECAIHFIRHNLNFEIK